MLNPIHNINIFKFFPLAFSTICLLSLLFFIFPWSLSTQTSSFSLSLDLDESEGDQSIASLDVFPDRTIPIQIFGTDIQSASDLSLRFEFDPAQVAYEGFKRSNIVSGTSALTGKDVANIGITLSANSPTTGLIGTIHFRTTEAFSGTDIRLVRARLVQGGQTETVSLDLSVTLKLVKPPSPDFDRSGTVGVPDFLLFVDVFGSKEGQERYDSKYDLNVNGEIGIPDFLLFIENFGKVVNRAPVFTSEPPVVLSIDENTPPGQLIGDLAATDGDGNTLTYRLSGADADSFAIDESTGQLQTKGTYNFEQQDKYSLTVHVSDGEGGEASLVAGITLTDINEPPEQPAPPSVSAIAPTSLTLIWEEPVNAGPEITDYDVQYRLADSDAFTDAEYDGTERSLRLTGLFSSTLYAIQVRATNEEGVSEWSESGEWKTSELAVIPGGGGGSSSGGGGGSSGGGGGGSSSGGSGGSSSGGGGGGSSGSGGGSSSGGGGGSSGGGGGGSSSGGSGGSSSGGGGGGSSGSGGGSSSGGGSGGTPPQPPPDEITLPPLNPSFTPVPDDNHIFGQAVTRAYSGDHTSTLDPDDHTRTHVQYDNGTLKPATNKPGINISNSISGSEYHAITIGSDADITVGGSYAANITTEGNSGNLQILNQGLITIDKSGIGIRAVMKASPGNILLVNDGEIRLNGFTEAPGSNQSNYRLVVGSINKAAEPHDFTNYSHKVELFNMPGGKLIATGPYNERVDGLKAETGSGHLTRLVNYAKGLIQIEGEGARGISAQSLWGASQAHNFGSIEINGLFAVGLYAGNCAPWPIEKNGCHEALNEIVPDRTSNVPGDVYARNYSGGTITTRATKRTDDTRQHRNGYGIRARSQMAGRTFAINEGTINTEGKNSHGIFASGYENDRDLDDDKYPNILDYLDTSEHDGIHVVNTGTISTDGEAAHGIRTEHHRGGEIKVFNTGDISATSNLSVGISVAAMGEDVPGPGCSTASGGPAAPGLDCVDVYRVGDVVVWNSGDIGPPEGVTEAPSIGIDVVSEGGDITITHTGNITAARIGIRVQTSGQGKITLNVSGALNAPKKYEVIGGTNNDIVVNEL